MWALCSISTSYNHIASSVKRMYIPISMIISHSVQSLVNVVLNECSDCVPESIIAKLLEAVLKSVTSPQHCAIFCHVFFFLANFYFRLPVSLGGGLSQEQLLESLLSVPVNDALLHLPLSQLPFHSVIVRMKTIGNHFNFYSLFPT